MKKKQLKVNSIYWKWSAAILLIAIVPMLASSLFFTNYFGKIIRDDNEILAKQTLQNNIVRMEEWVTSKTSAVDELIKAHPEFRSLNPDDIFPVVSILEQSDTQSEGYSIIDKNGTLLNSMGMTADMSESAYFLQAKETKKPAVSDMSYLEPLQKYIIPVLVPILDEKDEFIGGIAFSVTPDILTEMSQKIKMGDSGYGYFISGSGVYYSAHEPERIGKNITEYENTPQKEAVFQTILNEQKGSITYKDDNGDNLINYYGTVSNTDWKLIISVPENEVFGQVVEAQNITLATILIAALVVIVISMLATNVIVKPLLKISGVMKDVAEGDLTKRVTVKSKDEIGEMSHNINYMIESFHSIVVRINTTVGQVSSTSADLLVSAKHSAEVSGYVASAIGEVAVGANTQLQSTEQSARAMEEMTVGVGRITETAQEVTDQSDQVTKGVESGYEEIEAAINQMNIIGESVNSTALEIKEMEKHSEQIGQVVDVISKISRQTELLALNASIEAARAGEHGRGFAVVANEVKKLAEQTNESVSNVVTIISAIQQLMKNASQAVDQNISDIGDGISSIQGVGKTFDEIRSTIRVVNAQMQDISATTEELSAGAEEISASVVEMTSTAKESASNAEAIAASSEQQNVLINNVSQSFNNLNNLMDELKTLIDVFKV